MEENKHFKAFAFFGGHFFSPISYFSPSPERLHSFSGEHKSLQMIVKALKSNLIFSITRIVSFCREMLSSLLFFHHKNIFLTPFFPCNNFWGERKNLRANAKAHFFFFPITRTFAFPWKTLFFSKTFCEWTQKREVSRWNAIFFYYCNRLYIFLHISYY